MSAASEKRWARAHLLAELRALKLEGFACNVQTWDADSRKTNIRRCAGRRVEARRLLRIAIAAVESAR